MKKDAKCKRIVFRLTADDKKNIKLMSAEANLTVTDFILSKVYCPEALRRDMMWEQFANELRVLSNESEIGNKINLMTKMVNTNPNYLTDEFVLNYISLIEDYLEKMKKLGDSVNHIMQYIKRKK